MPWRNSRMAASYSLNCKGLGPQLSLWRLAAWDLLGGFLCAFIRLLGAKPPLLYSTKNLPKIPWAWASKNFQNLNFGPCLCNFLLVEETRNCHTAGTPGTFPRPSRPHGDLSGGKGTFGALRVRGSQRDLKRLLGTPGGS